MNKPIHQILQYSTESYEMLKDSLFLNWADEHAINTMHLQSIINNQKIYAWFCNEYSIKEQEFTTTLKQVNKEHPQVDIESIRILYDKFTSQIKFYPKALLNKCKVHPTIKIPLHNHIIINN